MDGYENAVANVGTLRLLSSRAEDEKALTELLAKFDVLEYLLTLRKDEKGGKSCWPTL